MSTNLYKRLKALLPDDPVMTGQISAVYADGTALVALEGAAKGALVLGIEPSARPRGVRGIGLHAGFPYLVVMRPVPV